MNVAGVVGAKRQRLRKEIEKMRNQVVSARNVMHYGLARQITDRIVEKECALNAFERIWKV